MAALLSICTKEEQYAAISLLWAESVPGAEIYQRLSAHFGNSALQGSVLNILSSSNTVSQV
jgi:hypothetical protein